MEKRAPLKRAKHRRDLPLFASPWVALFVLLRNELTAPRIDS